MIAVPVNAWRRNEQSEPLEELEGGERESGAATRCGMGKTIDDTLASGGTVPGSLQITLGSGKTKSDPFGRVLPITDRDHDVLFSVE